MSCDEGNYRTTSTNEGGVSPFEKRHMGCQITRRRLKGSLSMHQQVYLKTIVDKFDETGTKQAGGILQRHVIAAGVPEHGGGSDRNARDPIPRGSRGVYMVIDTPAAL